MYNRWHQNNKANSKIFRSITCCNCSSSIGIRIESINVSIIQAPELGEILSTIVTIVWIVGVTNSINLIDGLDGLSDIVKNKQLYCFYRVSAILGMFTIIICDSGIWKALSCFT